MVMTTAQTNRLGLNGLHASQEFAVVRRAVGTRVNSAMAIRAKRDHKARVVRTAVSKTPNVVRLEIGHAIDAKEGSRLATPLAMSFGTRNNIVAHVATAFEHGCSRLRFARSGVGGGESALAQLAEVRRRWRHFVNLLDHSGDAPQLEHDGVAQISKTIRRLFDVVRLIDVLVFEPKTVRVLPEEQKARTIGRVGDDGRVASLHRHGTDLALSKVFKYPVGPKAVSVSMRQAFFAGDYDNQLVLGRRNNAALLLPAEACVDIGPSVIDPAPLETPRHFFPHLSTGQVFALSGCPRVNLARAREAENKLRDIAMLDAVIAICKTRVAA